MELRQYTVSIIIATLITGILSSLVQNTALKRHLQILSGLFLTITILSPFTNMDISKRMESFSLLYQNANEIAEAGKGMAVDASAEIIKQKAEAYILNKAAEMDLELSVDVTVCNDDIPIPEFVSIAGNVSPAHQANLSWIINHDLGISKENQIWNG